MYEYFYYCTKAECSPAPPIFLFRTYLVKRAIMSSNLVIIQSDLDLVSVMMPIWP